MGKIGFILGFFLLCSWTVSAADLDYPYEAKQVVDAFLMQIDNGQFDECWSGASPVFQANISRQEWVRKMTCLRPLMGNLTQRTLKSAEPRTSIPGAPDGSYLIVLMQSVFEHKEKAIETIILRWDEVSRWTVSGYFIR